MKTIRATLLLCIVLLLSSCIFSIKKNEREFKRSEVLGKYEITKSSLRRVKHEEEENNIVTAFVLKSDSTIDATWGATKPINKIGTWTWKMEKRIGTDKFGLNYKSDVFVYAGHQLFGFLINEKDDALYLRAGKYEYKKQ